MDHSPAASIDKHFSNLEDPRIDRTKRHKLLDILVIAICAVICGADNWVEVELSRSMPKAIGNSKRSWLEKFLDLSNGIPSHDTFWRVFARLDPEKFQECFVNWIMAVSEVTQGQVVAVDGKTLRRSHDKNLGKDAISMVSAWASANKLVLGQVKVDEKSNEITAIPELLQTLALSDCIVTIDALGCQKEIAEIIVNQGADYILALKENHGQLYEDVIRLFDDLEQSQFKAYAYTYDRTVNKGHGRIEIRQCWVIADPEVLRYLRGATDWKKLRSVIKVQSERRSGEENSIQDRYFISCLESDAKQLLEGIRSHWGIENSLHWVLDVAFREDESRIRKDHGPENFVILRHIAVNLLKQDTSVKAGIKAKRLKAGWDEAYLLKLLSALF